jgi:serine protease inhibitor
MKRKQQGDTRQSQVGWRLIFDSKTLDHPFLFLIADEASSVILFLGRVSDPA